jgi:hypothetical protein
MGMHVAVLLGEAVADAVVVVVAVALIVDVMFEGFSWMSILRKRPKLYT